jgi:hypothetical protein
VQVNILTVKLNDLENVILGFIQLKEEVARLKEDLDESREMEIKYSDALEAVHADLKDAEAENESLRNHIERYKNTHMSPTKRILERPENFNCDFSEEESPSNSATQKACIKYLLAENNRLRLMGCSSTFFELFHRDDPLTKRFQNAHGKTSKKEIFTVLKIKKDWIQTCCKPSVVNLAAIDDSKGWKPKAKDPIYQLLSQRANIQSMIKRSTETMESLMHNKSMKGGHTNFRKIATVQIPSDSGIVQKAICHSLNQLNTLHSQFLSSSY